MAGNAPSSHVERGKIDGLAFLLGVLLLFATGIARGQSRPLTFEKEIGVGWQRHVWLDEFCSVQPGRNNGRIGRPVCA
jgi:hypothetical protein